MAGPRHVRIFLSSPGDVAEERDGARRMLESLPKQPMLRGRVTIDVVSWDDPEAAAPILASLTPQESVMRGLPLPSACDLTICMFWGRMGTPLAAFVTPDGLPYLSGTEWEFHDARSAGRDVLLYRRRSPVVAAVDDPDFAEKRRQKELVDRFFASLKNPDGSLEGGYRTYETPDEFLKLLRSDVESLITRLLLHPSRADESDPLPPPPEPPPVWPLWALWLGTLIAAAPVVGFLTSRMLDSGVGRTDRFGSAPWYSWPGWGFRAMIPVLGTMAGLIVIVAFVSSAGRLAYKAKFVQRFFGPAQVVVQTKIRWLATWRTVTLAQVIVIAHALTFVVSVWYFLPFIDALSGFQTWSGSLVELSPTRQPNHSLFGYVLTTELLVFWAAWHWLFRSRMLPDVREARTAVAGGMAMLLATLCLVTLPFRTLYHNESERVDYDALSPCYLVAEQDAQAVLFCPNSSPRSSTVKLSDPKLQRKGKLEDIFSELR